MMDKRKQKQMNFSIIWLLITLVGVWAFQSVVMGSLAPRQQEVQYSQFRQDLNDGLVDKVTIEGDQLYYTCETAGCGGEEAVAAEAAATPGWLANAWQQVQGEQDAAAQPEVVYDTVMVEDPDLIEELLAAGVEFGATIDTPSIWTTILGWILPFIPLALIWYFMFRRLGQQGNSPVMSIGKSKAKEITGAMTGVKYADVGGVDEVEVELKEIIQFLKTPERFTRLGAKLPKGILMVGPPGTGKTLLAKATAGEAGVPFFSISGSDFVEMFVGVGASRVRDMFEQAKQKAPCIVFIDEIDAIGQSRASIGKYGGNDEREQTLNQLLAEMDGFGDNNGVIIMAATNRPEVLDKALLRPGRFDRQIEVTLPTEDGRRQILDIHTEGVTLGEDADLGRLAKITPGFSGADLANVVNEAALLAVRHDRDMVMMSDFDEAIERVVAGLQKKLPLRDDVKKRVAYHEGGHALVAALLPNTHPVHKVSIIPTSKGALGYTMQMPEEDQYLVSEEELKQRMTVMLGGRVAERVIFGDVSTGASNDLERATEVARRMVTEFGMTEKLGPVRYSTPAGMAYLGMSNGVREDLSPETATLIDQEIRRLMEEAQERAMSLLKENETALHEIAEVLIEKEMIHGEDINTIVAKLH
ncbi:MAG: ATP-dependent zinc metalloprotease FtsH [Anaerolineaceae bacterium]|jgi:cell division protease FtsH|nr:ATP-dependent zinc metalloprotease FtsH [Anaerolineaceae bacterium]